MLKTSFTSQVSFLVPGLTPFNLSPFHLPPANCQVHAAAQGFPQVGRNAFTNYKSWPRDLACPIVFPFRHSNCSLAMIGARLTLDSCHLFPRHFPLICCTELKTGCSGLAGTCHFLSPVVLSSLQFSQHILQPSSVRAISPLHLLCLSSSVPSLLISLHPLSWFSHVTSVCDLTGLFF